MSPYGLSGPVVMSAQRLPDFMQEYFERGADYGIGL
jgi:hypothetical protein